MLIGPLGFSLQHSCSMQMQHLDPNCECLSLEDAYIQASAEQVCHLLVPRLGYITVPVQGNVMFYYKDAIASMHVH